MKRSSELRRSGFKKASYQRAPRQPLQPISPEVAARVRMDRAEQAAAPVPKTEPQRNPRLLAMARGKPCLLALPCCNHDPATTVAAHSNQSKHGKAGARKADDCFVVHACYACHTWLDSSGAPQEEKVAAWDAAHARQVTWWHAIANSYAHPGADRRAARWALERLEDGPSTGH